MNTLEIQKDVLNNKLAHNFNVADVPKEFCLLYGEVAEAYDAYRKKSENLGEELADIAIYLLSISEMLGYNLGDEIKKKMFINEQRVYVEKQGVKLKSESGLGQEPPTDFHNPLSEASENETVVAKKYTYIIEEAIANKDVDLIELKDCIETAVLYSNINMNRTANPVYIKEVSIVDNKLHMEIESQKGLRRRWIPYSLRQFALYLLDKNTPAYIGNLVQRDILLNLTTKSVTETDEMLDYEKYFPDGMK